MESSIVNGRRGSEGSERESKAVLRVISAAALDIPELSWRQLSAAATADTFLLSFLDMSLLVWLLSNRTAAQALAAVGESKNQRAR